MPQKMSQQIVPYRSATDAKTAIERVPGVRAVAMQRNKGSRILVVSAVTNGCRVSRMVPVCAAGMVADYSVKAALRGLGVDEGGYDVR